MSGLHCDAAASRALLDHRLAHALAREPWRDVAARAATADPARYADIAAPGAAAVLILLPLARVSDALVVADPWGCLTVPLARRCRVAALCDSPAQADILRAVAAAEDVTIAIALGTPDAPPYAAASRDLVIVPDLARLPAPPGALPSAALTALVALLRPGGVLYAGGANALAHGAAADAGGASLAEYQALFAAAGLVATRTWACWPHVTAPRRLAPLAAVAAELDRTAGDAAQARLARSGIAEHLAPTYAFVAAAPHAAEGTT